MRRWTPVLAIALALLIVTGSYSARAVAPVVAGIAGVLVGMAAMWLIDYFLSPHSKPVPGSSGWELIEAISFRDFDAARIYVATALNNLYMYNLTTTYYSRWAEALTDQHAGEGGNWSEMWIDPVADDIANVTYHVLRDYITVLSTEVADIQNLEAYAAGANIAYYDGNTQYKALYVTSLTSPPSKVYDTNFSPPKRNVIIVNHDDNFKLFILVNGTDILSTARIKQYIRGELDGDIKIKIVVNNAAHYATYLLLMDNDGNAGDDFNIDLVKLPKLLLSQARATYLEARNLARIRWQVVKDNKDSVKTPPPSVLFWDPKQLEKLSPTERMYAYYAWLRALANWNWTKMKEMTPDKVPVANITNGIVLCDGRIWFPLYVPSKCVIRAGNYTLPMDVPSLIIYPNGTYRYVVLEKGTAMCVKKLPGGKEAITLGPTTLTKWLELHGIIINPSTPSTTSSGIDWRKIALYGGGILVFLLIGIPVLSGLGERVERMAAGRGGRRGGGSRRRR